MSKLDDLCNEVQSLGHEQKKNLIVECVEDCLTNLNKIGIKRNDALQTVILIACCAAAADGRFAADEYPYIAALLSTKNSGINYSYDQCKSYISDLRNGSLEREATKLIRSLGSATSDLKHSLILLCILICSVDGYVSSDERSFLSNLF